MANLRHIYFVKLAIPNNGQDIPIYRFSNPDLSLRFNTMQSTRAHVSIYRQNSLSSLISWHLRGNDSQQGLPIFIEQAGLLSALDKEFLAFFWSLFPNNSKEDGTIYEIVAPRSGQSV